MIKIARLSTKYELLLTFLFACCSLIYLVQPSWISTPVDPDSLELLTALKGMGIAHPPGYSLYLQLNRLLNQLLSLEYWQTTLIFNSICLLIVLGSFLRICKNALIALSVWLILLNCEGVIYSIQTTEVYCLQLALFSLMLLALFDKGISSKFYFLILGFLLSHHSSSLIASSVFLVIMFRRRGSQLITNCPWVLVGPIHHIYLLYLNGNSIQIYNDWRQMNEFQAIWNHVTAVDYRSFLNLPNLASIESLIIEIWQGLPWWIFILIIYLLRRRKQFNYDFILFAVLAQLIFIACYQIPDRFIYLGLPHLILCVWCLKHLKSSSFKSIPLVTIICLCSMQILLNTFPQYENLEKIRELKNQAVTLSETHSNPIFIADDSIFALQYLKIEGRLNSAEVIRAERLKSRDSYKWLQMQLSHTNLKFPSLELESIRPYINSLVNSLRKQGLSDYSLSIKDIKNLMESRFIQHNARNFDIFVPVSLTSLKHWNWLKLPWINRGAYMQVIKEGQIDNPIYYLKRISHSELYMQANPIIDHVLKLTMRVSCNSTTNRESHFTDFASDVDLNKEITTSVTSLEKCEVWRVRIFSIQINQVDNKLVADAVLFDPSQ